MEPETLLDTDILSLIMRDNNAVLERARNYLADHSQLTISQITQFEILRGLKAKKATSRIRSFDELCGQLQILSLTNAIVVRASDIYATLYNHGMLIPDADILIAATAMEHGRVLATNNLADFTRIEGLIVDNWLG
jgi:tRNA(fMet)-specific endonuclease VapC